MAENYAVIGYEVTIRMFVELSDDVAESAKKIIDLDNVLNNPYPKSMSNAEARSIAALIIGGQTTIRLKQKKNPPPKPRNDAKRVIHAGDS